MAYVDINFLANKTFQEEERKKQNAAKAQQTQKTTSDGDLRSRTVNMNRKRADADANYAPAGVSRYHYDKLRDGSYTMAISKTPKKKAATPSPLPAPNVNIEPERDFDAEERAIRDRQADYSTKVLRAQSNPQLDPTYSLEDRQKDEEFYTKKYYEEEEALNKLMAEKHSRDTFENIANIDPEFQNYANKGKRKQNKVDLAFANSLVLLPDDATTETKMSRYIDTETEYLMMTDKEREIYRYFIGKGHEKTAQLYLDSIEAELNERLGTIYAKRIEEIENPIVKFGTVTGQAIGSGIESGVSGLENFYNSYIALNDAVPVQSPGQTTHALNMQSADGFTRFVGDLGYSAGKMVPAIAANFIPYVGPALSVGITGASSAGNAYADAKLEGKSDEEARKYGALEGVKEAGLQYLLGGITKLGGKFGASKVLSKIPGISKSKKIISNVVDKLAQNPSVRATFKASGKYFANAGDEAFEEYLQAILEPAVRNVAFGENNEIEFFNEDALYSAALGAASAGIFNVGDIPANYRDAKIDAQNKANPLPTPATQAQELPVVDTNKGMPKVESEKINPGARPSVREIVGDIDNTKYNIPKISTPVFKDDNGVKLPESKYQSALRKYMMRIFKGKILDIGEDNKVYISKRGIEEYVYPAKRLDNDIKFAKQAAGSSLDKTLKPAMFLINLLDDGRHPEVTGGWDNFYVMFNTDNGVYSGIVKTKITDKGREFHDITEIQKEDINSNASDVNKKNSLLASKESVSSTTTIPQPEQSVKPQPLPTPTTQLQELPVIDKLSAPSESASVKSNARIASEQMLKQELEDEALIGDGYTSSFTKLKTQIENTQNMVKGTTQYGEVYYIQKNSNGKYVAMVEGEGSGGFVPNELNKECDSFEEAYVSCWEYIFGRNPDLYSKTVNGYLEDAGAAAPKAAEITAGQNVAQVPEAVPLPIVQNDTQPQPLPIAATMPQKLKEMHDKIDNYAGKRGLKVLWYNDITRPDKADENGFYEKGTIYINENAENPYMEVFKHELFHSLGADAKQKVTSFFKKNVDQNSQKFIDYKNSVMDAYKQKDGTFDDTAFWEEYAAQNAEILLDENVIDQIARTDRNLAQRILDVIKRALEDFKSMFSSPRDYSAMRNRHDGLNVSGLSDAQLQKAARLYERALRKSGNNINSSENLEIGTSESYNGNINHSLKKGYWHTDLSKTQIKKVEKELRQTGSPGSTKITDTANWYSGRLDGEDLFVIYSTEDVNNPTILYEAKGNDAKEELNVLLNYMEEIENGEGVDRKSSYVNWVSSSGWLQQKNSAQNSNSASRRKSDNKNAGVLQGQSGRDTSRALWNVIDNLLGRQGEVVPESKTARSLKRSAIFGDSPAAVEDVAASSNNVTPNVPEHTKPSISQTGYLTLELDGQSETASDSLLGWANDKIKERNEAYARAAEALQDIRVSDGAKKKGPGVKKQVSELSNEFRRKFVDAGASVQDFAKVTGDKHLYAYYNNVKQAQTAGQHQITKAQTDLKGKKVGKSLDEIFNPVLSQGVEYTKAFDEYLLHRHNVDRIKVGKPITFTGDLDAYMATSTEMVNTLSRQHPEFEALAEDVYAYIRNMMQMRVDAGLITKQEADYMQELYPHYVPTHREMGENYFALDTIGEENAVVGTGIKSALGSDLDIIPLYEQISKMTMQTVSQAKRNVFANRLANLVVNDPMMAASFAQVPKDYDGMMSLDDLKGEMLNGNMLVYHRNGKTEALQLSNEMVEAIKDLTAQNKEHGKIYNSARKVNSVYKSLITEYSLPFTIRNIMRDFPDALFASKDTVAFLRHLPEAMKDMKNNGELWQQFEALGGTASSLFDYDYKSGTFEGSGWLKRNTLDRISELNRFVEMIPRFAEFYATVKKGDGGYANLMDAMHNAADVTVNFQRGGSWVKPMNSTLFPFLNASVQGASKNLRIFTEAKGAKQWLALAVKAALFGLAPSVINELILGDDEDYKELRDYDKMDNYIFKLPNKQFIKIPGGRLTKSIGNFGAEVVKLLRGDETDFAAVGKNALTQLGPLNPLESNLFAPISNVMNNRTWYGGEIENSRLQELPVAERYDTDTSEISKAVGKTLNVSPKKVDYLIDSYTGILGDTILPIFTNPDGDSVAFKDKATGVAKKAFIDPLAKKFYIDGEMSNEISSKFYDKLDEVAQRANGQNGNETDKLTLKYLNSQKKKLSDLYAAIRDIESDTSISHAQRQEDVRELQSLISDIQRETLANADKYAEVAKKYSGKNEEESYFLANRDALGLDYAIESMTNDSKAAKIKSFTDVGISAEKSFDIIDGFSKIESDTDDWGRNISGSKNKKSVEYIEGLGLESNQKAAVYKAYMYSDVDERYNFLANKIGITDDVLGDIYGKLSIIEGSKNSQGKTISGSQNRNVYNYINTLSLSGEQRRLLFAWFASSTNEQKKQRYNVINNLNISQGDKETVLQWLQGNKTISNDYINKIFNRGKK